MKRLDTKSYDCAAGCPVEATLDLIDGKWKAVILYHLLGDTIRFNELGRRLSRITQRMLTRQLRAPPARTPPTPTFPRPLRQLAESCFSRGLLHVLLHPSFKSSRSASAATEEFPAGPAVTGCGNFCEVRLCRSNVAR